MIQLMKWIKDKLRKLFKDYSIDMNRKTINNITVINNKEMLH